MFDDEFGYDDYRDELDTMDDYNRFEERQLDLDREAGEFEDGDGPSDEMEPCDECGADTGEPCSEACPSRSIVRDRDRMDAATEEWEHRQREAQLQDMEFEDRIGGTGAEVWDGE